MPFEWNNHIVVTKEELVPDWYTWPNLKSTISRYQDKPYGIKRLQLGGNGRQLLVAYDSLPPHIQQGLGDPRKVNHILERYYKIDSDAVAYYASEFKFPDGSYLDQEHQEEYIINASVLQAIIKLRSARESERHSKGKTLKGIPSTLCSDAISFQKVLHTKHRVQHTIPESYKHFSQTLKEFEKDGYSTLVSGKHKNANRRKVTDATLELLNNLFAGQSYKPTATEIAKQYDCFLTGYLGVINNATGEIYDPKEYKKLGHRTITNYLAQWSNAIGTHGKRSGDRQKFMSAFSPFHSLDKPKFAGSVISIDDRQPPFKYGDNKRVWFYNGIDLGSEAFTCWVYGHTKEGIIEDFYRQLIRNYHEWDFNIPAELEAEMSLNSMYVNTFLQEGSMFQYVRIEANKARAKRIEAYYKPLRYGLEKKREGWLARPKALSESNQAGPEPVKEIPYDDIIEGCLRDIETWNNMPHSVHTDMSRWEVFQTMQNPKLKPTNYNSFLPHIGHKTQTSCNVGFIQLQRKFFCLGDNGVLARGERLINLMKQAEGKEVDVYWLDDNQGKVFKALVFIGDQMICEAIAKPTYNRATIERTPQDEANRTLMSAYQTTIESYGRDQLHNLDKVTIIDNTPPLKKSFIMPGIKQHKGMHDYKIPETMPELPDEDFAFATTASNSRSQKDRF